MASSSRGFILIERAIFFSSSSCSLVLVISLRASPAPASDFFDPAPSLPAFWASSISCLFASASPPHVLLQEDQGVHSENLVTAGCEDTAAAAAAMTGTGQGPVLQDLD